MATAILETNYLDFNESGITHARITASDEDTLTFSGVLSALLTLSGVAAPAEDTDAATKYYVDSMSKGLNWKAPVQAASVLNLDLTSYSGPYTLDGVALEVGDRVLLKNQTDAVENGIYVIRDGAEPIRASDLLAGSNPKGAAIFVEAGTVNGDSAFVCTNDGSAIVDDANLNFAVFARTGEITAGEGLTRDGNNLYVNVDDSTIEITADVLSVKDGGVTNAHLDQSQITITAGDGLNSGGSVALGDSLSLGVNVDDSSIQIYSNTLRIKNLGVPTDKLDDSAVTTVKLGSDAVTTVQIDDSAVTTDKIATSTVTTDKIETSSVTTEKIAGSAVTTDKLDASAITTAKILNSSVTNAKLENSSLTVSAGAGLGDGGLVSLGGEVSLSINVDNSSIELNADALRIKDSGIVTDKIANAAITTAKIENSAVTNTKLANSSLSVLAGAGLGNGGSVDLGSSVTLSINVDDSSIEVSTDALQIKDLGVTTAKINDSAVETVKIDSAAVTTDKLASSSVTTAKIDNNSVTPDKLASSAVTTVKITNASVTNAKLENSSLTVTAGAGLGNGGSVSLGGEVSLSVNVDGSSIEIDEDALRIKDSGVTTSKISGAAVTTAKINNSAVTNAKLVNSSLSVLAGAGLGGGGLVDLGSSVTLSVNVDGSSIEIDEDALQIKALGVTTAKLNDSAVTTIKINDAAVTTDKLNASAVTTAQINDGAVTEDKLASSAVTTTKILDGNVTNAKLAYSSVTVIAGVGLGDGGSVSLGGEVSLSVNVDDSSIEIDADADALRIKDSGVTTAKIAEAAVTTAKINDAAVTNVKLANSSITVTAGAGLGGGGSVDLGSSVALSVNVDDSSIEINSGALRIKDSGVTTAELADSAVTTAKLNDANVTTAKIDSSAVTTSGILDANVTNVKLENSSVSVTAGDGLQSGGSVSLGDSVSLAVDSSVVRTTGTQSVGGAKTFTSAAVVSNSTASSSSSTGCLTLAGGVGVAGNVYSGNEMFGVAFNATSDAALKTDIAPITDALDKVSKINAVAFKFKFIENDCTHFGVLAQQLEDNGLECMVKRGDKHLAVEYNSLTGLLLAAVKDLSAEIHELESHFNIN
jgi:hypothetical protein